jgi:hypothetical protein
MSVSRLVLGALASVVATVPAMAAPAAQGVVAVETSGSDILRLSDAARDQILDKSHASLTVLARGKVFVQESGPSFVQWRAQVKAQMNDAGPSAAGDVRLAFAQSMPHIG